MDDCDKPLRSGLDKNAANFTPADADRLSAAKCVGLSEPARRRAYGERRYSPGARPRTLPPARRALAAEGIRRGDTVALIAPNIPEAFEAHFGVPMLGQCLNA